MDILSISPEIALWWMPRDFTDNKSALAQVMAWCRQATSHYLNQYRPSSLTHMASQGHSELKQMVAQSPMVIRIRQDKLNISASAEVKAWHLIYDKPSPELMTTKMSDTIWHHWAAMS